MMKLATFIAFAILALALVNGQNMEDKSSDPSSTDEQNKNEDSGSLKDQSVESNEEVNSYFYDFNDIGSNPE